MKKIIAALMVAANAHPGVRSVIPESLSSILISSVIPPVASPISVMPIAPSPEFSNRTIGLGPRHVQGRDRADDFTCKGVEYFEPDVDIDCVVHRRTTEFHWNYMFDIKISPAGLAYSQVGLDKRYAYFEKNFVDRWDSDALGDMPKDGKWYESFTVDSWMESNWGAGMRIESSETSLRRLKAKVWGPRRGEGRPSV